MSDIAGVPMMGRVIQRLKGTPLIDAVVIATTTSPSDDEIVAYCEANGVSFIRGSEDDVLARYALALEGTQADAVVRATADCPLLDPDVTNTVIERFLETGCDFASNVLEVSYPNGADIEVCSADALRAAHAEATAPEEREHVMPFMYRRRDRFHVEAVEAPASLHRPEYRLCVDAEDDLALVRAIYGALGAHGEFSLQQVVDYLDAHPDLAQSNVHIPQKKLGE